MSGAVSGTDILPAVLADLRSDRGMAWVPDDAWLTKVAIDGRANQIGFDLAIDPTGQAIPSRIDAGLDLPGQLDPGVASTIRWAVGMTFMLVGVGGLLFLIWMRPSGTGTPSAA